ncbi:energy-coupling factor transporter ATPase [Paenibacillus hubeiensis]|uniref:energy-coupling factor transporter ATPase n=1 Tax=Paenibacillus hubeiensis TaxID=3077330 RepID=UPI0031BB3B74
MLTLDQVHFYYRKGQDVLHDISLSVPKGEFAAIIGGNGSGKSTLAKLMKGLLQPKKGEIRFDDWCTSKPEEAAKIHQHIGMVFQNPDDQFITTTVTDEIVFGMENIRLSRAEMHVRLHQVLNEVGLEREAEMSPHQLSGGQKQRVAIAAILAMQPDVIVLDEATSMLDPEGRRQIMCILQELHLRGVTVIHITHHMDEVLYAERVISLNAGRMAFDGTPAAFFETQPLNEYGLEQPFAARLRMALAGSVGDKPLTPDWKEWIRERWHTS